MKKNFLFAEAKDIKHYEEYNQEKDYYYYSYNYSNTYSQKDNLFLVKTDDSPWNVSPGNFSKHFLENTRDKVEFCFYYISNKPQHNYYQPTLYNAKIEYKELFFVSLEHKNYQNDLKEIPEKLKEIASSATNINYISGGSYNDNGKFCFQIEYNGVNVCLVTNAVIAKWIFDLKLTENMTFVISNGLECQFDNWKDIITTKNRDGSLNKFDYTLESLNGITGKFNVGDTETLLKALVKKGILPEDFDNLSGIKKTWEKLKPITKDLVYKDPFKLCVYRSIANLCNKSIETVKVSSVFNDLFGEISKEKEFVDAISKIEPYQLTYYKYPCFSTIDTIKNLKIFREKRKISLKKNNGRAISKVFEETDSLTIDKKKHKLTWKEIESGNLPIGAFFRKKEQYFVLNDNWDLWEEMFRRGFGEETLKLANEVKTRTTYEKDLMSYFYFILYALPDYLKKYTGHKWKCIPKLVNSSEELEPPEEEGGVSRKRSSLTPTANNETKEVIVPYASLAVGGRYGTTYCYSHDYHVLTKGFSFSGNVVTKEIEEKLNGRDDYGLMFYTLTGSSQGRGYPTFLIIFERRSSKQDTRVHFHRTHPSRSKQGDYNSINNWIKVCYNWMVGNVDKNNIVATQGDLAFVRQEKSTELDFSYEVDRYDNHCFAEPVSFAEYTKSAKSNILGYVNLEKNVVLNHNEHDSVLIPPGMYAIYQCRSWEANPKGVWSLRID